MKQHRADHDVDVRLHSCDMHDEKFKQAGDLKRHHDNVHGIDMSLDAARQSAVLGSQWRDVESLKAHRSRAHGIDVQWHSCDMCEKRFKYAGVLKRHRVDVHDNDVRRRVREEGHTRPASLKQ